MRTIKFRAWDKEEKVMIRSNHAVDFSGEVVYYKMGCVLPAKNIELMQYTGLKDMHGKDIYEGDIVKGFYPSLGTVRFGKHTTSTDYYASEAYGWYIETEDKDEYSLTTQHNTEVIGNIYETPEILN